MKNLPIFKSFRAYLKREKKNKERMIFKRKNNVKYSGIPNL